jgi:hypothetical protein
MADRFMIGVGLWLREVIRKEEQEAFDEGEISPQQSYFLSLYHLLCETDGRTPTLSREGEWAVNFPEGARLGDMARNNLEEKAKVLVAQGVILSLEYIREQSSHGPMSFLLEAGSGGQELK